MLYNRQSDTHDGLVVELVYTADLKSAARNGRDGSSPSEATTFGRCLTLFML